MPPIDNTYEACRHCGGAIHRQGRVWVHASGLLSCGGLAFAEPHICPDIDELREAALEQAYGDLEDALAHTTIRDEIAEEIRQQVLAEVAEALLIGRRA